MWVVQPQERVICYVRIFASVIRSSVQAVGWVSKPTVRPGHSTILWIPGICSRVPFPSYINPRSRQRAIEGTCSRRRSRKAPMMFCPRYNRKSSCGGQTAALKKKNPVYTFIHILGHFHIQFHIPWISMGNPHVNLKSTLRKKSHFLTRIRCWIFPLKSVPNVHLIYVKLVWHWMDADRHQNLHQAPPGRL